MKSISLVFFLMLLGLNMALHAMLPKRLIEPHRSTFCPQEEEKERRDSRDEEEREDTDDEEEEEKVRGQLSQGILEGNDSLATIQHPPSPYVIKELLPTKPPSCNLRFSPPKIGFMDHVKKTFHSWSSPLDLLKRQASSSDLSRENKFQGTKVEPVLGQEKQSSFLKSGLGPHSLLGKAEEKATKMVAFRVEHSEEKVSEEVQSLEKKIFPGYEIIEKYSLEVAQIRVQLNNNLKKLKALSKDDPERLFQAAQLYAAAYPKVRDVIQQVWNLVQQEPLYRHEKMAFFLAGQTIKIVEMASKTVAWSELKPIKKIADIFPPEKRPIEIPFEATTLRVCEKYQLPSIDLKHEVIFHQANHVVESLQSLKKIISSSCLPEQRGEALRQAQIDQARREYLVSSKRLDCIEVKLDLLTMQPVYIPEEKRNHPLIGQLWEQFLKESNLCRAFNQQVLAKKRSEPISDPAEAKRVAIEELFSLIQPGLDIAVQLREMLEERRKDL